MRALLATAGLALTGLPLAAQTSAPPPRILGCTDASGRAIRTDRPIADCAEHQLFGTDGSTRGTARRPLSPGEQDALDRDQRARDALIAEQNSAVRRDRLLLSRFPDEAAHRKAREAALEARRASIAGQERRLADLATERRTLDQEREFYPKPLPLPFKLKNAIDANDAAVSGIRDAIAGQQSEIARINAAFDEQLPRLRRLWAGAREGHPEPARTSAR